MLGFKVHAPEFTNLPIQFVNTKPFSLQELKGNVVLLDFWTYCCINCIHTIPDLKFLEEHFKDDPFVVTGIHSAKFDNENNVKNVLNAAGRYEISHPIILDQEHAVWDHYAVHAWPTLVLIDTEGYARKAYSGEGHREELTADITDLLAEAKEKNTLGKKFEPTFTNQSEPSLLKFPGKISINNDTIVIANSNRNNILVGTLGESSITITTTIGNGMEGSTDGRFSETSFFRPQSALLHDDKIYVADTENHRIRVIDMQEKQVSTLQTPYMSSPWDLAIDGDNLYIALAGSHQIGMYSLTNQEFRIFAGNRYENIVDGFALQASLAQPSGLSIHNNTLYFADSETSSIRFIRLQDPYYVQTIAGHGLFEFGLMDGPTSATLFQHPLGLTVREDTIYVADTYNSAIRTIDLSKNEVHTLIKPMSHEVCRIDDKDCNVLPLDEPADVKVWKNSLIISDTNNHLIRRLDLDTKDLVTLDIQAATL